jgi:hypothetical protein
MSAALLALGCASYQNGVFGTNRALATRLAFHGTNGAPATAVGYGMHTLGVEQSDLPKTGAFDKIMFRYS